MPHCFSAPRLKITRAGLHIQELRNELLKFVASSPARLIEDRIEVDPAPEIASCIVGDAIHNLRAALDILACDLARSRGRSIDKVKFPFADSQEKLELMVREHFKVGDDLCIQHVLKLRPFKGQGGNQALRALHDLDISDKHRDLIPINRYIPIIHLDESGTDAALLLPWNIKISPNLYITLKFSFGANTPFAGKPTLKTLEDLVEMVEGIVQAFETIVASRTA